MVKLGLMLGYSGKTLNIPIDLIRHAESLGYDSVWTAEAYGSDAVTPATWILAHTTRIRVGTCIMQIPARTPAMAAMTAMTLSQLSGGRFIAGLGASGPQVVEGWHGIPYNKPVTRTREYIQIMREIMAREGPVTFDGEVYQLPTRIEGATGLGKPLKSILQADTEIPIYTASITPAGLACAAEVADGVFPIWMSPEKFETTLLPHYQKGFDRGLEGKTLANFANVPGLSVVLGDDVDACRMTVKHFMALYIGGMGAKGKNFYTTYASTLGYEEEALRVQELYLAGKKDEAVKAVPDALVDEVALVGPEKRIRERAEAWIEAGDKGLVDTLMISTLQPDVIDLLADIFTDKS
ncbi:Putative coenzyme F420-dependent oxidoreductase [BD1-7 clade bacterium]|uniref:Coenzyme F420-dependent oxidoreductase n=1 Tax=BD1-7 clade bacterium TaxID=2029982 RepID=A0A5S9QZV8_9GAMM|nr:Putative coenzyme F420-dependent oxidoreductase [BD1-7 clade bacterium]